MLEGKKIVIGITGSIAAFKAPYLVRLLKKEGAEVKVMMTPCARDFVTPLTLSTLSGNPVLVDPFDPSDGTWNNHVELGRWADLYIIAPASANTLAKMAHGVADNLLLTAYLSAKCPVFFAPAMDLDMYKHPVTQNNIRILESFGNRLIEPVVGELASGLTGAGRMEEPEKILEIVQAFFSQKKKNPLTGKKVLVTAGPTFEALDPVRYLGNFSSGKMGFCIAEELDGRGAEVTLVTGPTNLNLKSASITRKNVVSAEEMLEACAGPFKDADILVMAAAVADFKPGMVAGEKIKKSGQGLTLQLVPTTDILATLSKKKKKSQVIVGFALETHAELDHARKKLADKNLDLIVLNSLKDSGAGFGTTTNKVTMIDRSGKATEFPLKSKEEVAVDIADSISAIIRPSRR
jgi:phosphopantothenoylcysteine decarboxylase / phosphopantothenate---cysteine ligase